MHLHVFIYLSGQREADVVAYKASDFLRLLQIDTDETLQDFCPSILETTLEKLDYSKNKTICLDQKKNIFLVFN